VELTTAATALAVVIAGLMASSTLVLTGIRLLLVSHLRGSAREAHEAARALVLSGGFLALVVVVAARAARLLDDTSSTIPSVPLLPATEVVAASGAVLVLVDVWSWSRRDASSQADQPAESRLDGPR
jgi:hypothetical protein